MEEVTAQTYRGRSLNDYFRILLKRRWVALAVLVGVFAIVALHTFTATPMYRASVQLLLERQTPRLLDQQTTSSPYDFFGEEFYQTQYKLLESPALAKKVVQKLDLKNNKYYKQIFQGLPPNADEGMKQRAEQGLVSAIAGGVEVSPIRQSSLVNVRFTHSDPKFAALIVNTLARCYIEQSLELRFSASQETANWLEQKLVDARRKMEDSETKLNQYKREFGIVAPEDKESITAQKLEQLNKELVTAQTRRMEAETRYREVKANKPIPQVLNNPLIQALKTQEAKILAEQSELGRKFGPMHPRMIQLTHELSATRAKIQAEKSQVEQSVENEYTMARNQETSLKAALEGQKADTQDLSDRGIKYRTLLRDVESNRALYENMLKSLKSMVATESIPPTNIRIVYPATVPDTPFSPKKARNLGLGLLLGGFFAVVLVMGLEQMDTTLKTPEDVEGWLEIPNLAMIPHLEISGHPDEVPELVMHHGTNPLASESYRVLRTSILFSSAGHSPRVLMVTSTLPMEGKTLTVANLAAAMANAEPRVLLVDSDLRRPSLHEFFAVPKEPGLSNFLVGEIDELPIMATPVDNLFLIPSGLIPPNPSELLGSARMQEFLARAQEQFGRVILDSAPLMSVTDSTILSTLVDGVLLVVKAEAVPRKLAMEAKDHLLEVKAHLLGAVLNDVSFQRGGYHYNYYYQSHSHRQPQESPAPRIRRSPKKFFLPAGWIDRLKDLVSTKPPRHPDN
jgi:succinoglycan biosynthesis transport protein ExoP